MHLVIQSEPHSYQHKKAIFPVPSKIPKLQLHRRLHEQVTSYCSLLQLLPPSVFNRSLTSSKTEEQHHKSQGINQRFSSKAATSNCLTLSCQCQDLSSSSIIVPYLTYTQRPCQLLQKPFLFWAHSCLLCLGNCLSSRNHFTPVHRGLYDSCFQ